MVQRIVSVGVVLGAAALSSQAFAQESRRLDFGLQAQVEHNTNVSRTNDAQAQQRGLSQEDTTFTPTATFDLLAPVGRQSVFLRGAAGYSFYDKNKNLNRERYDVTGGVNGRLGPCSGTLTGGYTRGINVIDDPTLISNVENIQDTEHVGVDLSCARQTGFGVTGAVSKDWINNDLPFLRTSDSEQTSATIGVTYSRPALGVLTVFANKQKTEYPNRPIDDGYDLDAFGITFERQLGARIQGSVTVAYTQVDQHAPPLPGLSGENLETTAYSASLSYRASSRLRFQGLFDRSVTPSSGIGRTYDLSETYRLSGDYDLGSRITLSAGVGLVERESAGLLPAQVLQLTDSEMTTIFGSVRYKQSDRLAFILTAGREERTTNAAQFDYANNRIGVTADLTF